MQRQLLFPSEPKLPRAVPSSSASAKGPNHTNTRKHLSHIKNGIGKRFCSSVKSEVDLRATKRKIAATRAVASKRPYQGGASSMRIGNNRSVLDWPSDQLTNAQSNGNLHLVNIVDKTGFQIVCSELKYRHLRALSLLKAAHCADQFRALRAK